MPFKDFVCVCLTVRDEIFWRPTWDCPSFTLVHVSNFRLIMFMQILDEFYKKPKDFERVEGNVSQPLLLAFLWSPEKQNSTVTFKQIQCTLLHSPNFVLALVCTRVSVSQNQNRNRAADLIIYCISPTHTELEYAWVEEAALVTGRDLSLYFIPLLN